MVEFSSHMFHSLASRKQQCLPARRPGCTQNYFFKKLIVSNRVSALFITCTLFLVFVDVTSSKTSSRVIPRNNSSNNLLRAVFWLESDKNTARNKLYSKNYSRYVGLRISSGTGAKIVSSRTFFSSSIIFFIVNFFSVKKKKSLQLSP
jgi:hypothetical protein